MALWISCCRLCRCPRPYPTQPVSQEAVIEQHSDEVSVLKISSFLLLAFGVSLCPQVSPHFWHIGLWRTRLAGDSNCIWSSHDGKISILLALAKRRLGKCFGLKRVRIWMRRSIVGQVKERSVCVTDGERRKEWRCERVVCIKAMKCALRVTSSQLALLSGMLLDSQNSVGEYIWSGLDVDMIHQYQLWHRCKLKKWGNEEMEKIKR